MPSASAARAARLCRVLGGGARFDFIANDRAGSSIRRRRTYRSLNPLLY